MALRGVVRQGEYFDSVTLMAVARHIGSLTGVTDCAVVMGTKENKAILESAGLMMPEFVPAKDTDLMMAVRAGRENEADKALLEAEVHLRESRKNRGSLHEAGPASLESALRVLPDANMAIVSVAGRFAADVALDCLKKGVHVMLFSNNIPIDREVELKTLAFSKGLLLMGPDCGSAIINGLPLGFANAVRRGNVGIVAAAGTGLQEISTLLSNGGAGISQAIGTGSRDVKKEIGGSTFRQALKAVAADESTQVIVLVAKPPDPDVLNVILDEAGQVAKAVVAVFLGEDANRLSTRGLHICSTLEEAALSAAALSRGENRDTADRYLVERDQELIRIASIEAASKSTGQRYLRGLFCGGTLAAEAQVILRPMIGEVYSNAPIRYGLCLGNPLESIRNTVVDFGDDEFTVGRPHPMIDYSLRNRRILREARDPETAVVLLDVVIGYGTNPRPAQELAPILIEARGIASDAGRCLTVVCSVTGTDRDPQCRKDVMEALEEAGALVQESNAAACRLAGHIIKMLRRQTN